MSKNALIVIDMQNDFVNGSLGFSNAEKVLAPIEEEIKKSRSCGDDILFTMDTHAQDYLKTREGKSLPTPHCIQHTNGWKLAPSIAALKQEKDRVFYKNTFGSLNLGEYLKEQKYHTVTIVGLVSSVCVLSNAVIAQAALPQANIIIPSHCIAGPDPALHQAALQTMQGLQIKIR